MTKPVTKPADTKPGALQPPSFLGSGTGLASTDKKEDLKLPPKKIDLKKPTEPVIDKKDFEEGKPTISTSPKIVVRPKNAPKGTKILTKGDSDFDDDWD